MKTFLSFAILIFALKTFADSINDASLAVTNFATPKISAWEATNYFDQTVIVTGKVAQVTIRSSVTFLNLDKSYPNSPFAIVIFHGHSSFYGDANALKGKSIEIKGKVKNYHDKPEMALDNTNQLTVLGVTNLDLLLKPQTLQKTNAPPAIQSTNLPEIM